jgi:diguanylate cyclase (GGDEF)-like protein/PAS domain S-box-containing protein
VSTQLAPAATHAAGSPPGAISATRSNGVSARPLHWERLELPGPICRQPLEPVIQQPRPLARIRDLSERPSSSNGATKMPRLTATARTLTPGAHPRLDLVGDSSELPRPAGLRRAPQVCGPRSRSSWYMAPESGETLLSAVPRAEQIAPDAAMPVDELSGAAIDVERDQQLLSRLRASEEQFRAVVASIPGAVYRCACGSWEFRFMSDHIEQICGFPATDFLGDRARTYGSIIHRDDRQYVIDQIERALKQGSPYVLQYRIMHAAGGERWVSERGRAVLSAQGERLWLDGVILDVTEQVLAEQDRDRAEHQLRRQSELNHHQALHDALTGLPNRTLFHDRAGLAILAAQRNASQLAVLVMDLDRFKEINDTLGHSCGDRFLGEVAIRLRSTLRGADSIARLGGDEFGMILQGIDADSVAAAADRIALAFETPFVLDGLPLQIEASIGVALYPQDDRDVDGLIRRADVAMYAAKRDNVGWALYDRTQDRNEPARLSLIGELRRAIDDRELVLHYQPKVNLRGGGVAGVEALVRWHHPTRGLLLPDLFIDVAQETSLIRPFTLYVIDEALRQCHAWAQQPRRLLAVAVNVTARNLMDTNFPDHVGALLEKWGLPATVLELEIAESAIVANMFRMKAVLERLGEMGLRLSVDDFGTGYTSLGYLRRLPITELKIDGSFIANMATSEEDAVIVRSAIDLGRNLGLAVVAEGVEDAAVLRRLEQLGCDLAQGYALGRPVPAEELSQWLSRLDAETERRAADASPVQWPWPGESASARPSAER